MNIHVLGCSGAIAQNCRTTSFLVDDNLLIDAGTGVGDLTLDQMRNIDHVLLTHCHLDHVAGLALMIDSVAISRDKPLQVHALPGTIAALQAHVFNGTIWPDFCGIPSLEKPSMAFVPFELGQSLRLDNHVIEVLPAVHTVPAVAFAVRNSTQSAHWVFSGDTGPNPEFWKRVNALEVGVLVVETAFSEKERAIADISLHLSPRLLAEQLTQLSEAHQRNMRVYLTHAKPSQAQQIERELSELATQYGQNLSILSSIKALQTGQILVV